jgi:alpha-D-xyloside xylohydrolase
VVTLFKLRTRASATEGFYGTGERPDHVKQRGRLRPMQIELDGELESKNDEGHVPVPLLVGTRGWGLFVESRRVGAFDIARSEADLIETTFAAGDEGLTVHLFTAPSALDVYKHYYDVTGAPRLPAPWALGPMVWRNENKDQAQLLDDLKQLRTRDLATTALWIDRPYATAVNSFDFDAAKFPDAPAMIAAVHEAGFRLGPDETLQGSVAEVDARLLQQSINPDTFRV